MRLKKICYFLMFIFSLESSAISDELCVGLESVALGSVGIGIISFATACGAYADKITQPENAQLSSNKITFNKSLPCFLACGTISFAIAIISIIISMQTCD